MTGVSRHDFVEVTFLLRKVQNVDERRNGEGEEIKPRVIVSTVGLDAPRR